MIKRIGKILVYAVPYLGMWLCAMVVYLVVSAEGMAVNFSIFLGKTFDVIYKITAVAVFLSICIPLINRKISRFIPYCLSLVFFLSYIVLNNYAASRVEFSPDIWREYPQERLLMYDDFISKYDIKDCDREDIEKLLGEPDSIMDDGTYYYSDGSHSNVAVEFEDDKAYDVYTVN